MDNFSNFSNFSEQYAMHGCVDESILLVQTDPSKISRELFTEQCDAVCSINNMLKDATLILQKFTDDELIRSPHLYELVDVLEGMLETTNIAMAQSEGI